MNMAVQKNSSTILKGAEMCLRFCNTHDFQIILDYCPMAFTSAILLMGNPRLHTKILTVWFKHVTRALIQPVLTISKRQ